MLNKRERGELERAIKALRDTPYLNLYDAADTQVVPHTGRLANLIECALEAALQSAPAPSGEARAFGDEPRGCPTPGACSCPAALAPAGDDGLAWAVSRWRAEVEHRPLINKNRRPLDDAWRQVIRYFGGDPDVLVGPDHDSRIADLGGA